MAAATPIATCASTRAWVVSYYGTGSGRGRDGGLPRCARWPATALRLPRPWRRPCSTPRPTAAGSSWTTSRARCGLRRNCRPPEGPRTPGACLQRLHAITPPTGLAAFDPVSIATGQAQAILKLDPSAAAQVNALVARTLADPVYDLACLSVYYP